MIQVEYSFCKIRLLATGLTLPWQLVAAQEPGPTYLSFPIMLRRSFHFAPAARAEGREKRTARVRRSGDGSRFSFEVRFGWIAYIFSARKKSRNEAESLWGHEVPG